MHIDSFEADIKQTKDYIAMEMEVFPKLKKYAIFD